MEALLKARDEESVAKVMHQRATDIEETKKRVETARRQAWEASPEYQAYKKREKARDDEKKLIRVAQGRQKSKSYHRH